MEKNQIFLSFFFLLKILPPTNVIEVTAASVVNFEHVSASGSRFEKGTYCERFKASFS